MTRSFSYSEKVVRKRFVFICIFIFAVTIVIYTFISNFLFKTYRMQTQNMSPTFTGGEIIATTPLFKAENLKRGDIVYQKARYKSNLNFLQHFVNNVFALFTAKLVQPFGGDRSAITHGAVLRVVGLPGDTIYIKDFVAYIKNTSNKTFLTEFELSDVDYNISTTQLPDGWESDLPFSGTTEEFVLSKDEFFLLSDNRVTTLDSRISGKCKAEDIDGKVLFVSWPIRAWRKF